MKSVLFFFLWEKKINLIKGHFFYHDLWSVSTKKFDFLYESFFFCEKKVLVVKTKKKRHWTCKMRGKCVRNMYFTRNCYTKTMFVIPLYTWVIPRQLNQAMTAWHPWSWICLIIFFTVNFNQSQKKFSYHVDTLEL
jgi:hypothetical protein